MSPTSSSLLWWAPRIAGIAATLFLGLFALDAFDGRPPGEAVPDLAMHLLPAAVCGGLVALAWRRPRVGAVAFGALALGYAVSVPARPEWIALISGPLAVVAVLFALGARRFRQRTV